MASRATVKKTLKEQQRLENKKGFHPLKPREQPGYPDNTKKQKKLRGEQNFLKAIGRSYKK